MRTHHDADYLASLEEKAKRMRKAGESEITGGKEGEPELAKWSKAGVDVTKRPDDEHGILRVSVGGNEDMAYCVFRGKRAECIRLLRRALKALTR